MKSLRIEKKEYICHNGPWAGQSLWLNSPTTIPVKVGKKTGRYKLSDNFKERQYLVWEEIK
jgi:hypothetical protein